MIIGISHIKSRDNFYNKPHNLLNSSSSFSQLISGLSWNSGFNKLVAFSMSGRILCSVTLGFPIDSVLHLSTTMASATSVCSKKIYKNVNIDNRKRDTLNYDKVDKSIFESVELNSITEAQPLGTNSISTVESKNSSSNNYFAPVYYSLNVSYVSQATNSNYCWASSVACIGNFLKNKSYTGEYVAQYVYGTNYDQGATPAQALAALKNIYGVSYTYYSTVPSDNTILNSISSLRRPLYSRWSSSAGSHATVIDGINVIAGYITIMNPASGFMSASANGSSYTYISLNSGNTFTLYAYAN